MWTKEQIKNSDIVIKGIKNSDYNKKETIYYDKLVDEIGFYKIEGVIKLLITQKLAYSIDDNNYYLQLTGLGNFASHIGVKYYIYLKYFIISLLAIIPIAISVFSLLKNEENVISVRPNESNNGNYKTENINNPINNDSVFIEKNKYSIKHDSIFLNELKENIKHENKITTP